MKQRITDILRLTLAAGIKLLIKTVWGSDKWCQLEGYHRWDVHAWTDQLSDRTWPNVSSNPAESFIPTAAEVTCVECGAYEYFDSWDAFTAWAVEDVRRFNKIAGEL